MAVFIWLFAGAVSVSGWPISAPWIRVAVGLAGLIVGVVTSQRRVWLVMHSASKVLHQIQNTLQATCVEHQVFDNSVHVVATGTKVRICGFRHVSLVEFHVVDRRSNKERFLLEVLSKYLRFIGKNGACQRL